MSNECKEYNLTVVRIPGDQFSYTNLFYHNKDDINDSKGEGAFLTIFDTIKNKSWSLLKD